ncbi:MAG: GDP-mannose 4,6-dehydratase [bacterium]
MKSILLTGGAGFIGSATLVALLARGYNVCVVDNFEPTLYGRNRKEANLEWAREHGDFMFHELDIRDAGELDALFAAGQFDAVIHLAAVAGVRPSIQNAPLYFDINVTGTSRVLEVGRKHGVGRFVLASSSSVYGGNTKVPFAETDPVDHPVSPYAASKRALELLAYTDQHLHGGDIACLRFFTVYGPRQRPEMAMHKFSAVDRRGRFRSMLIGMHAHDYTYIDDIVAGVMASLDRIDGFRVWNLGGDRVVRLDQMISTLSDVIGRPANIERLPMQPGDVEVTNADLTRASAELDYAPSTSLEVGLEHMWQWYQRYRE